MPTPLLTGPGRRPAAHEADSGGVKGDLLCAGEIAGPCFGSRCSGAPCQFCQCPVGSEGVTISGVQLPRSVLLADDHEEFRAAIVRHLEPYVEVVRTVDNGEAVLEEAVRLEPDVIVLDISMPVLNGIETARKLSATSLTARIVFLTVQADPAYVDVALETGALGYVLKSELASDLIPCLKEAFVGRSFVSPAIARQ